MYSRDTFTYAIFSIQAHHEDYIMNGYMLKTNSSILTKTINWNLIY